ETAAQFEWLGIVPDTDAYLLLSLLHVMFAENLADRAAIARHADGLAWLEVMAGAFTPEAASAYTGIAPETIRGLARELAHTPRAAVYGRFGTCVGRHGTLTSYLIDAVNLVAGNLDRAGGSMFGSLGLPAERWLMKAAGAAMRRVYEKKRNRVGAFRSVLGAEPASVMAKEITTPGSGQIRAMFVSAGNPVLSVPNGAELEEALETLDLMVAIDLYVNETNAHGDYVLPATTMYERDDFPLTFQALQATPFRQATEAVVAPAGHARQEWQIIDELMHRLRWRTPAFAALALVRKVLALFGAALTPRMMIDAVIRFSGGGLTFTRLTSEHPHGVVVQPHLAAGVLRRTVVYRGAKVRLRHPDIENEIAKLWRPSAPDGFPLRMIGMREARSENSWMHNAPLLMRGGRHHRALMHVKDAEPLNIGDGDTVRVTSPHGQIELPVALTTDIVDGVIAIPHGWGHRGTGNWRVANGAGGANVNQLMSSAPQDLEALAGMARLTGVPVRVEPAS
ncbi:MAG: molybdopterin-dependent oxidoreductase, partial [Mycobacteriaceae bacterium]|nr:molybdopterin-dependent oxidoreductase [Mycobacteriaceae bacterium]